MGIFDYVILGKELRERLGKYGDEGYQTKYKVKQGFITVYNGFDIYRVLWRIHVWIELLVEPSSPLPEIEPLMNTVKLEEIGKVHSVEISVSLEACIFNSRDVEDRLEEHGFAGPIDIIDNVSELIHREIGALNLEKNRAELELIKIRDENTPLGIKTLLRIRSGEFELIVKPNVTLHVYGDKIHVEAEKTVYKKIRIRKWRKELVFRDNKIVIEVSMRYDTTPTAEAILYIKSHSEITPGQVDEKYIETMVKLVEDTAKEILLKHR